MDATIIGSGTGALRWQARQRGTRTGRAARNV
jgi:hypothetical protein